jgi:hypothetical protein
MKKIVNVLIVCILVLLSGCSMLNGPDDNVREAISNMYNAEHSKFKTTQTLDVKSAIGNSKVQLDIEGKTDQSDEDNFKSDLHVKAAGVVKSADVSGSIAIDVNVIMSGLKLYVKLNSFKEPDDVKPLMPIYKPVIDKYKGKWVVLDSKILPEGSEKLLLASAEEESEATREIQEQISELIEKTYFFDVVNDKGVTEINNVPVHEYEVKLSKRNTVNFLINVNKILNEAAKKEGIDSYSDSEGAAVKLMEEMYDTFNAFGVMYIGVDDLMIYKSKLYLNNKIPENNFQWELTIDGESDKIDEKAKVEVPQNAANILEVMADLGTAVDQASAIAPPVPELSDI